MITRGLAWAALALAAVVSGSAVAGPAARADGDAPPASLLSGKAARGAALDPVFAHFKVERLACTFSEQKHIALLARPLRSTGTLHFERGKGIARTTLTPRVSQVVVTTTSLRIRDGQRTEEVPLDKSEDLKAFALILPTLLRGDRAELERAFELGLYGRDTGWWALTFTPRADSLRALVRSVVVYGRKGVLVSLRVAEASGDTTETRLAEIRTNGAVSDAEIETAFGAP